MLHPILYDVLRSFDHTSVMQEDYVTESKPIKTNILGETTETKKKKP